MNIFLRFTKFFCLIFICTTVNAITEGETTLLSLQLIFNHGVRSVLYNYPNNPNNIWSRYSSSLGQLTDVGMKQMYDYGVYLRNKYYPFLNSSYDRTRAWAVATDHDRNLQSAYSVLVGLYQPNIYQIWIKNSNLTGYLPIPVHTAPVADDQILHRHAPCPRFDQLQAQAKLNNSCNEKVYQDFLTKMKNISGLTTLTYYDMWQIAEKALIDRAHNLTVDKYILDNYAKLMEIRDNNFYATYIYDTEMAKLLSGALLNNIVSYFYRRINGTTRNELYMYGVFDYYVSAMQRILNTTTEYTQPNFGASFVFELRREIKNTSNYYVQVLYKNNDVFEPDNLQPVKIAGCDTLCPVDKFRDIVSSRLVTSFDESCKTVEQFKSGTADSKYFSIKNLVLFNFLYLIYSLILDFN